MQHTGIGHVFPGVMWWSSCSRGPLVSEVTPWEMIPPDELSPERVLFNRFISRHSIKETKTRTHIGIYYYLGFLTLIGWCSCCRSCKAQGLVKNSRARGGWCQCGTWHLEAGPPRTGRWRKVITGRRRRDATRDTVIRGCDNSGVSCHIRHPPSIP